MKRSKISARAAAAVAVAVTLMISAFASAAGAAGSSGTSSGSSSGTSSGSTSGTAAVSAVTYYLWGMNTNDPHFDTMSKPTGAFSYDSDAGLYYYDLTGSSGDYCFVVSTVSSSGAFAQRNPAVGTVADSGSYFLSRGSYAGFDCMHIWNPAAHDIRLYFVSPSGGLYAVRASGSEPTEASQADQPTQATVDPDEPFDGGYVYCDDLAGWGNIYVYMWSGSGEVHNKEWPGEPMTDIGDGYWEYEVTYPYESIIFYSAGKGKTIDLAFPGVGYAYDDSTGEWSLYDSSRLKIKSFTADMGSPQYAGSEILLSAVAGVDGVSCRFTVTDSGGDTSVLSDYSEKNTAIWTPKTAGDYTLSVWLRDSDGNTNSRSMSYRIEDGLASIKPYIKRVTPRTGSRIAVGEECELSVSAGGGLTGTGLLFYKFTVTDENGEIVNTPYYTLSSKFSFTPTAVGRYTVGVSAQGSDNSTVLRELVYDCAQTGEGPTQPPVGDTLGDTDGDGEVTILDATNIQRWLAGMIADSEIYLDASDTDGDGEVTILDATRIQRLLAGIIESFKEA